MMNKVVVVTGAGKGIGKEIAIRFAKEGYIVAICSKTIKNLKNVEREIKKVGGDVLALSCDIGVESQVKRFITNVSQITGFIDVLVNNAGVAFSESVSRLDLSKWEEIIRVNLTGTFLVTKYALVHMSKEGHIFNIVSNAGKFGFPYWSAYCASKFGVLGFTNSIREELRSQDIKVTAILPGPTDTPLWEDIPGSWDRNRMIKPYAIADTIFNIYKQPSEVMTEEVFLMPRGGNF
ncbi:MAG: SDR family oxidoreductase [Thermodesulfobacteriota bacterium]